MTEGYNRNNQNQKPPTVLKEYALRLTGDPINGSKRSPSLMLDVKREGKSGPWCVYIDVRTGVEGDPEHGKIAFTLDLPTAFAFLHLVEKAAERAAAGEEANFDRMELLNRRYLRQQNQMSKEPMLEGTIAVGWTADGKVYIGVKSWDNARPHCKFVLKPVVDFRRAVKLYKKDGTPWDEGPLSQFFARGWAKGLAELVVQRYGQEFTPPAPREQQGDNGGGNRGGASYGGNRGGGNSGASSANASDGWSDDDIPM
jgi:hypothetical protein